MKLSLPLLLLSSITSSLALKSNTSLGRKLISKARRLDEGDDAAVDYSWIAGYSLKFQGCHHVSQWNGDVDDVEDVRVMTKRLVRFRLCPSGSCSNDDGYGCESGYGDYILDMNTYVEAYYEAKKEAEEQACEQVKENCGCEDNGDDAYDEEACEYQCYVDAGLESCAKDEDEDEFEVEDYLECAQFAGPEDDDGGRRLDEDEEEEKLYIGPYCANQGGDIYLGMFTDDTCTEYADDLSGSYTYKQMTGSSLPYSSQTIVGSDCMSCLKQDDKDEGDDGAVEYEASESCQQLYVESGKCESSLDVDEPNENACAFMSGVEIIMESGVVSTAEVKASPTASVFIAIFAIAFCLLGAYVYYLQDKLKSTKAPMAQS